MYHIRLETLEREYEVVVKLGFKEYFIWHSVVNSGEWAFLPSFDSLNVIITLPLDWPRFCTLYTLHRAPTHAIKHARCGMNNSVSKAPCHGCLAGY